jgi:2-amino-4-hydroxy-6-hydroxymethyldihydropteridine diphosphokinase
MSRCFIGLGANLGDAHATLQAAIKRLATIDASAIVACSAFFRSAPIDAGGDDFCNAVVELDSAIDAHALLDGLQKIEHEFGRQRPYLNAPRTLDLDLLLFGDEQIATPRLQVPHPRMHLRAFVLHPLLQLAPDIDLPGLGRASTFLPAVATQAIAQWD